MTVYFGGVGNLIPRISEQIQSAINLLKYQLDELMRTRDTLLAKKVVDKAESLLLEDLTKGEEESVTHTRKCALEFLIRIGR